MSRFALAVIVLLVIATSSETRRHKKHRQRQRHHRALGEWKPIDHGSDEYSQMITYADELEEYTGYIYKAEYQVANGTLYRLQYVNARDDKSTCTLELYVPPAKKPKPVRREKVCTPLEEVPKSSYPKLLNYLADHMEDNEKKYKLEKPAYYTKIENGYLYVLAYGGIEHQTEHAYEWRCVWVFTVLNNTPVYPGIGESCVG